MPAQTGAFPLPRLLPSVTPDAASGRQGPPGLGLPPAPLAHGSASQVRLLVYWLVPKTEQTTQLI